MTPRSAAATIPTDPSSAAPVRLAALLVLVTAALQLVAGLMVIVMVLSIL